jgi:hypothetical protein
MTTETAVKIQHMARLHKVNFDLDPRKHTVYFADQAKRATSEPLQGWANPGSSKAYIGDTEEEIVERIRVQLAKDILLWDDRADLKDFSFVVAFEDIKDGAFWPSFRMTTGTPFKVHEFNEWGR